MRSLLPFWCLIHKWLLGWAGLGWRHGPACPRLAAPAHTHTRPSLLPTPPQPAGGLRGRQEDSRAGQEGSELGSRARTRRGGARGAVGVSRSGLGHRSPELVPLLPPCRNLRIPQPQNVPSCRDTSPSPSPERCVCTEKQTRQDFNRKSSPRYC